MTGVVPRAELSEQDGKTENRGEEGGQMVRVWERGKDKGGSWAAKKGALAALNWVAKYLTTYFITI